MKQSISADRFLFLCQFLRPPSSGCRRQKGKGMCENNSKICADKKTTKKTRLFPSKHEYIGLHPTAKTARKKPWIFKTPRLSLIAGAGFEPDDLRVMSPTSYQTALPRDIQLINRRCRTPGSNRYDTFVSRDFKSRASANSATPAHSPALGASLCCSYIIARQLAFVNTFLKKV